MPKEIDPDNPAFKKVETYNPIQGAAYIQDRIELGDLVVRAGLRYEYFNPNAIRTQQSSEPGKSIQGCTRFSSAKCKNQTYHLHRVLVSDFP